MVPIWNVEQVFLEGVRCVRAPRIPAFRRPFNESWSWSRFFLRFLPPNCVFLRKLGFRNVRTSAWEVTFRNDRLADVYRSTVSLFLLQYCLRNIVAPILYQILVRRWNDPCFVTRKLARRLSISSKLALGARSAAKTPWALRRADWRWMTRCSTRPWTPRTGQPVKHPYSVFPVRRKSSAIFRIPRWLDGACFCKRKGAMDVLPY